MKGERIMVWLAHLWKRPRKSSPLTQRGKFLKSLTISPRIRSPLFLFQLTFVAPCPCPDSPKYPSTLTIPPEEAHRIDAKPLSSLENFGLNVF